MQRHKGAYGYFSGERFAKTTNPEEFADEIALNPVHFATRKPIEVLSTLAHEMVHLWQHHTGKPPRKGYHDKEWATKMREIGLIPTDTGEVGGKETGQKMTHVINENGRFAEPRLRLFKNILKSFRHLSELMFFMKQSKQAPRLEITPDKKVIYKNNFTNLHEGVNIYYDENTNKNRDRIPKSKYSKNCHYKGDYNRENYCNWDNN